MTETEGKFSIVFDLPESQLRDLLAHCREVQKPVGEVAPVAIAYYLKQMQIQESQMAKALAD